MFPDVYFQKHYSVFFDSHNIMAATSFDCDEAGS